MCGVHHEVFGVPRTEFPMQTVVAGHMAWVPDAQLRALWSLDWMQSRTPRGDPSITMYMDDCLLVHTSIDPLCISRAA